MLRILFGEPPRKTEGKLLETIQAMEQYAALLSKLIQQGQDADHKLRKYEIYTKGLISSLDELEQSQYAARKYGALITSMTIEAMSVEEMMYYRRHVYFDKNAFIRLFALLDKLGTLMNDYLGLQTERVKAHFSYFTVLRTLFQRNVYPELTLPLHMLKEEHKEAMNRLRKRRNTEIHYMNSEMQDDLKQNQEAYSEQHRLENIEQQTQDLAQLMDLVLDTLKLTFHHAYRQMKK
ncbi:Cthe_2314 family HEPN domain-containing protein [Paenibacillus sp. R14(2021)]|uniref:Cthe_2314 family HEPN domain-containing protein n=1 Tax=Paenibacillus sp. R14(2021) TaxID=2859228 RepID=UPI001C612134|nr:Cthe_2314 family HEPN domain-containing protein [Paenibacillus sp. R14(2021)]